MTTYAPGAAVTLELEFFDEASGILTDPSSVQLDITYGATLGSGAPDFAGPFSYAGASMPTPGQVYRVSTGLYAFVWTIPNTAPAGVYIANWTVVYGAAGDTFLGFDNVTVQGSGLTPPLSGDIGFWTGSVANGMTVLPLGAQDVNGTAWLLLGVDGMDGTPTSGQVVQRAGDHGGFPTPQWYSARPITLRIQASAQTQALRDTARALLQQAIPVNKLATFTYGEPVPKTLLVRRSGAIRESYPTTLDCVFTVGLIAPDPRKYGASWSFTVNANGQLLGITPPLTPPIALPSQPPPGSVSATNYGNFETRPTITITGPITAPAVYNQTTGMSISFSTVTLGATDTLVLDLLNKVAYLDGAFIGADLWSSWWVLPPGTSQIVLQGSNSGGAQMTVAYQDAWM